MDVSVPTQGGSGTVYGTIRAGYDGTISNSISANGASYNIFNVTNTNTQMIAELRPGTEAFSSTGFTLKKIELIANTDGVAPGSSVLCDVYYFG